MVAGQEQTLTSIDLALPIPGDSERMIFAPVLASELFSALQTGRGPKDCSILYASYPQQIPQISSLLRNGTPKSSLFSNHLFTESQQTDSFEIGKEGLVCASPYAACFLNLASIQGTLITLCGENLSNDYLLIDTFQYGLIILA
jgi:hypothetical protein